MNRIIGCLLLCFGLLSCSLSQEKNEIYFTKGIPSGGQSFSYMYFKNEQEGYLFGVYKDILNHEELRKNPEARSIVKYERNVYVTKDGGHNWIKTDSSSSMEGIWYNDYAVIKDDNIYIKTGNITGGITTYIDVYSLKEDKIIKQKKIDDKYYALLKGDKEGINLLASNKNRRNFSIITYDSDLKLVDSVGVGLNYFSNGIIISDTLYFNSRLQGELKSIFIDDKNKKINTVDLPIFPEAMVQSGDSNIILIGNSKYDENSVYFVNYNIHAGKYKIIKELQGYSAITQFQSNDKVMLALVGNAKGFAVVYDMIYSLDKGKTWIIRELEEKMTIKPSYLIDDVLYIYGSSKIMQKIRFDE